MKIIETAEAVTAEATALVWEEYNAPRKRIPRARIIEHHLTVSIPKYAETAAPLAFVVERDGQEAQPIRYANGKLYTPARFVSDRYSDDPAEELRRALIGVGVPAYVLEEYAAEIARDNVRADRWRTYGGQDAKTAEQDAQSHAAVFAVISGELYHQCNEPVYEYVRAWRETAAHIDVIVSSDRYCMRDYYGAFDQVAIAAHHASAEYRAHIEVMRPDLVTIDATARDLMHKLETEQQREQTTAESLARHEESIREERKELEQQREKVAKARADLAAYQADPKGYYLALCERMEASKFASVRSKAEALKAQVNQ